MLTDCGILSSATPKEVDGELMCLEFVPVLGNTPAILLRETITSPKVTEKIFDKHQEAYLQKATEKRNGLKYVYTFSDTQPGRYFVMCKNRQYSNELNIDGGSRSEGNDKGMVMEIKNISKAYFCKCPFRFMTLKCFPHAIYC